MISYFTYESRNTFFITVKTITKLNLQHCDNCEIEIKKISRSGSRSSANAELGHFTSLFCKCTKNYNARAELLFCLLIVLFSDAPVAVAISVFVNPLTLKF